MFNTYTSSSRYSTEIKTPLIYNIFFQFILITHLGRMTSVIINQSWLIAVDVKSINFRDYKKSHDRITFRVSRGDERGRELGDHVVVLRTGRREDFKHFSGAHQRASRNGPSHDEVRPWWGVSRGLSGDFMYITIPEVGTRAVHCWLTGRRSRRSRVVCAARHTKWNGSHMCRREKSFSFSFSFFFKAKYISSCDRYWVYMRATRKRRVKVT